ncbi:MAG: transcriptional regulator [Bacteroidetes bacterium]|nr:MAG: transcriptional regulator [Bacteroidota bacterium]
MAKFEKLYYPIGEAAKYFGEEISAIRYWEKQFPILKPQKNSRGVRRFTATDMENLETIHYLLRVKKLTIKGAKLELAQNNEKVQGKVEILRKLKMVHSLLEKIKNKL